LAFARVRSALVAALLVCGPPRAIAQQPAWQFGGFADLAYLFDGNEPPNHETRSRGTAWRVNEVDLNVAALTVAKPATDRSRWGAELILHAGRDTEKFAFSATAPNLGASNWLRYVGRGNITYASRSGWRWQGGIFSSLIGYDSLYAKDNLNYTRPWTADFTPYVMMGVNASRALNERITVTIFGVNGYWHLAHANHLANGGAQLAFARGATTIKHTVLIGPHQADTSFDHWRILSDTVVEHRRKRLTAAFNGQFASERVDTSGRPRAWWAAAQLPLKWTFDAHWSAAVRAEAAWDSRGRWTMFEQRVNAWTATIDYRRSAGSISSTVRLEYGRTTSRGRDGGFFASSSVDHTGLVPTQRVFIASLLLDYR
jgi:hypothetical protein